MLSSGGDFRQGWIKWSGLNQWLHKENDQSSQDLVDLKDSGWFVSHRGKFSKDVNGRVKHQKESSKEEGADEKMSKRCRVHRAKGV